MKLEDRLNILNLARYYHGFQKSGPEVNVGYRHVIYLVNIETETIEEIDVARDDIVNSFHQNPDISQYDQQIIVRSWDEYRRSIGESGYFTGIVIHKDHTYKVDGALRTVERQPNSF